MNIVIPAKQLEEERLKSNLVESQLDLVARAAGLGTFGRHNLIIHPHLGTRVIYTAILNELDLPSDPQVTEDLCIDCNICVESCPTGALDEEGKTHMMKCLRNSQPHGLGGDISFWRKFVDSTPEAQKKCSWYCQLG